MMISLKRQGGKKSSRRSRKQDGDYLSSILEDRSHLLTEQDDFFTQEAYKTLRSNVIFSLSGEDEGSKVIQVTSAMASEGKSTTTVNLAISFAMTDRKVLLIDCDMRRPKLASLLQLKGSPGLSNVLVDYKLLEKAITPTSVPKLDVMTAGDVPPNPSELLGSKRMAALLSDMRKVYDYVILDTPPVNVVTDSVVLASRVGSDGVLFVVRAGHSERWSVQQATEQLEYAKVKVLGFVLNGVAAEWGGTGKYGYRKYKQYGYGYAYGSHGSNHKSESEGE